MPELQLAEIAQAASHFRDRKVVELAVDAKDKFYQQGDLDHAADAIRLIVSAKCALLEDPTQIARDGVSMCQQNARGRQLGTQRAEAKMLLAFAEAVQGMNLTETLPEAIDAAANAHNHFASNGDGRLHVEACVVLTHLHLSRAQRKDLQLALKSAESAMEASQMMHSRCRGSALLARAAVAFPNWHHFAEKALELAIDLVDLSLEVEVRLAMARWWARMHEYESSLEQAKEALDVLQEQGAGCHRQIPATQLACDCLVQIRNAEKDPSHAHFAKALLLSQDLLRVAEMEASEAVRILAARHLMQIQTNCSEHSKAIQTGKETLKWYLQRPSGRDYHCEGEILQTIMQAYARIKLSASQREEIQHTCGLSLAVIQQLVHSQAGLSQAVELMSEILRSYSLLGKPLEAWAAASQLREVVRDSTCQAPLVLAMATAMHDAGRLEECCTFAQDAARVFEDQCDDRQAAYALSLVATAQLKVGKYSACRQNGRRARRRFAEIGECEEEIHMRMVVARACTGKDERGIKQLKDAVREAKEATKLAVEFGKHDLVAESLATYVEVLLQADQLELCCQVADELLRLEVPAGFDHQVSALFHAAKAQEQLANFLAAKTYAERVVQLAPKVTGDKFNAVFQESKDMIAKLHKKCLFDYSTSPPLGPKKGQEEETLVSNKDSRPRCGYESTEGNSAPSKRSPAVKAGFFTKREEHAPLKLRIQELTGKLLGLSSEEVEVDTPLKDIGLSSGAAVILRDELQNDIKGIRLPPTIFFDYPTVNSVVGYVTGKLR